LLALGGLLALTALLLAGGGLFTAKAPTASLTASRTAKSMPTPASTQVLAITATQEKGILQTETTQNVTALPTQTPIVLIVTATTEPSTSQPIEATPNLVGAYVMASGYSNGKQLVTISLPMEVKDDYRATVNNLDFQCIKLEQYPKRLYCSGKKLSPGSYVIKLYLLNGEKSLLELAFIVSSEPTATKEPKEAPPNVPSPSPYPYP